MKLKLIYLLVIVGMLCAGCGNKEENNRFPDLNAGVIEENQQSDQTAENATENATGNSTDPTEEPAPYILTFEATTTEGETITSDCLANSKLTMINVWATYCNPCLVEMPDLGEIAAEYDKSEFQILGIVSDVTTEDSQESVDYAKELIEETQANYTHMLLNESLYMNLVGGIEAVPTTFFVTWEGEVLGYAVGANSKEGWVQLINQLLAEIDK